VGIRSFIPPNRFRALAATPEAHALWRSLNERENVIRMVATTDLGYPAVLAIDDDFSDRFPHLVSQAGTRSWPWRQLVGAMAKQIMQANGYAPLKSKPIRNGRSFRNGMCYRREGRGRGGKS